MVLIVEKESGCLSIVEAKDVVVYIEAALWRWHQMEHLQPNKTKKQNKFSV